MIIVTIPAHNEAKTIGTVISRVKKALSNESHAVMVVADNCSDDTVGIAKEAGAIVFGRNSRKGLADTFRLEMRLALKAKPEMIVHIDADGQYLPSEIPKLIKEVRNGYDLVLGSRLTGYLEHMVFSKKLFNKLAAKIFSMLLKRRIDDVTTGFRAFTPDIAKLPIKSNFTYTQEQIIRACKLGYKVKNVPVNFMARDGESKLMKHSADYIARSLRELWKLNKEVNLLK